MPGTIASHLDGPLLDRLLRRISRISQISKGDDTDAGLKAGISFDERVAEWGGIAVIVGLIAEALSAPWLSSGKTSLEIWAPVVTNGLIALGVAAEVLFSRRARAKSESLQRRSDERVAEANARALEAQLALERYKAPRSLSYEHKTKSIIRLREYVGMKADILLYEDHPEATALAALLHDLLVTATWKVSVWRTVGTGSFLGVSIRRLGSLHVSEDVKAAAQLLLELLNEGGLANQEEVDWFFRGDWPNVVGPPIPPDSEMAPIRIMIGTKPA